MLPKGNQGQVLINETDCKFSDGEREYSGQGAFVDQQIAVVYIGIKYPIITGLPASLEPTIEPRHASGPVSILAKDWHGSVIGEGFITAIWHQTNYREKYKMASVSFCIEGLWYKGRFAPDHGDMCRGTRLRTKKVIEDLTAKLQSR